MPVSSTSSHTTADIDTHTQPCLTLSVQHQPHWHTDTWHLQNLAHALVTLLPSHQINQTLLDELINDTLCFRCVASTCINLSVARLCIWERSDIRRIQRRRSFPKTLTDPVLTRSGVFRARACGERSRKRLNSTLVQLDSLMVLQSRVLHRSRQERRYSHCAFLMLQTLKQHVEREKKPHGAVGRVLFLIFSEEKDMFNTRTLLGFHFKFSDNKGICICYVRDLKTYSISDIFS